MFEGVDVKRQTALRQGRRARKEKTKKKRAVTPIRGNPGPYRELSVLLSGDLLETSDTRMVFPDVKI
jgi:hypothetical protein